MTRGGADLIPSNGNSANARIDPELEARNAFTPDSDSARLERAVRLALPIQPLASATLMLRAKWEHD